MSASFLHLIRRPYSSKPLTRISSSGLKSYKPITPSLRHRLSLHNPHLFRGSPLRLLTLPKKSTSGRNSDGRITVRHRGGGHKRRLRVVDFNRMEGGVRDVVRIEYDPGRSGHIALLRARDGDVEPGERWSYILACEGLRAGHTVQSFRKGIPRDLIPNLSEGDASESSLAIGLLRSLTLKPGNVLPLSHIPPGTLIHNISLKPLGRMILVRSAGSWGQVQLHEEGGRYTHVRLQSGEVRKVLSECCATIGRVSNGMHKNRNLGKAGRARWLGIRPSVRGVAMNKNDHPHGGGRGKSKSNKHPVSPWGWGTKGTRTRKPGPWGPKNSNKMVITERPRGVKRRKL